MITATVKWHDQSKSGSASFREKAPYQEMYMLDSPHSAEFIVDANAMISGYIRVTSYKKDKFGNTTTVPITADVSIDSYSGYDVGNLRAEITYFGGTEYTINLIFGSPGEVNGYNYNNSGTITINQTPLNGDSVRDTKTTSI